MKRFHLLALAALLALTVSGLNALPFGDLSAASATAGGRVP